ncbi:MAG: hypothetical protein K6G00_00555 [Treponema sp.]|nr:hypothetical protein [Treponema sp.]
MTKKFTAKNLGVTTKQFEELKNDKYAFSSIEEIMEENSNVEFFVWSSVEELAQESDNSLREDDDDDFAFGQFLIETASQYPEREMYFEFSDGKVFQAYAA